MSEYALEQLFDEFAQAYLRGEGPDVPSYLARAGAQRHDLGDLIDRFLQAVPAQAPTEEEIVLMQAQLEREPALLVLRRRRRLTRDAVVGALVRALGLDSAKRTKVGGYYHRLETGLLDPEFVDASVWAVLSDTLRANVRALADFRPPPLAAPVARRDMDADWVLLEQAAPSAPAMAAEVPDEVDRLFTGAS